MKKILFSIVIVLALFSLASKALLATDNFDHMFNNPDAYNQSIGSAVEGDGLNLEAWSLQTINNTLRGVNCLLTGSCRQSQSPVIINNPDSSVMGGLSSLIKALYNPSFSTQRYLADLKENFGFITAPVHAQGVGFKALVPILPLWKTMRNLCYLFLIIVLVATGFAIMFRQKLNPQTATHYP